MNKIEHEGIGTCARIEMSQDADSADQKVKLFLKVLKTYKLCVNNFFPSFYTCSHFTNFLFSPPPPPPPPTENES